MVPITMSWQLFVVWHKTLVDEHYTEDSSFTHDKYVFLKANPLYRGSHNPHFGYRLAYEHMLPHYDASLQQKVYMMPGVIYNVYMSQLHSNLDYIGFIEYDIPLEEGTTRKIQSIVDSHPRCVIPLSYRNTFQLLASQTIQLRGRQCMVSIVEDFNTYFNTVHTVEALWKKNPILTTQQSFLADRQTFGEMAQFLTWVVTNKLAERDPANPEATWPRPSTLLDRYIGLALHLLAPVVVPVPLKHISMQLWL